MRIKLILHIVICLPSYHAEVVARTEHDRTIILYLLFNLGLHCGFREDVHLDTVEDRPSLNLLILN